MTATDDAGKVIEELRACPFCGGTNIKIQSNGIGDFYAICQADDDSERDCGARTSDYSCETQDYAAERWNTRTAASRAASAPGGQEGWQLVPAEADEAMWQAGREADIHPGDSYNAVYRAMIAASRAASAPAFDPQCRHGCRQAVGLYLLPQGCPCFDDKEQWLCEQHLVKLRQNLYTAIPIFERPLAASPEPVRSEGPELAQKDRDNG